MRVSRTLPLLAALALVAGACGDDDGGEASEDFQIGMILVGPQNDTGWSQAHFEAGEYVMEELGLPAENLIVLDKVNTSDRPETTIDSVVTDMIDQGADLIFATSDDMKDGIAEAAANNPEVPMIWSTGDSAWDQGKAYREDLENLGNVMGQMEFGKMIAGCAAALTTETGRLSYLGPLINDETRRLVNSAYLGATHCWTEVLGNSADDLAFEVKWIGFWFNIPGFTLDPTQVTNEFLAAGSDVIISGIDTTEALVRAGQESDAGEAVWAVPYDFEDACSEAPSVCLGVPYFNWGPSYLDIAQSVIDDDFEAGWEWVGPNWDDLNDRDTSAIGWLNGDGLAGDDAEQLGLFIDDLGSGEINLWAGPLTYQDGSTFVEDGETASDFEVWYTEQLLEGIEGASAPE
ncbi:MAG: BMP family ABC transporter substrate-binding protein [Ilumatobacter sp.]|uniref:BMP family lipoprotein n=1 Tax=Ilumatobacter sp. TaxID=1967498 RepID=UPI00260FF7F9|nr:BMP family ABC transporter substrate-binding protein [Ilumatobacter sp.]MDJ0767628.1 BMP family ABC transporter substrate-binding protein [Ilumatobacter sp.]